MHSAIKNYSQNDILKNYSIIPFDVNLNANMVYLENFKIQPNITTLEHFKT